MAAIGYPTECLSAYCGRILCDGCSSKPRLVAFHMKKGTLADYEAGQIRARQLVTENRITARISLESSQEQML